MVSEYLLYLWGMASDDAVRGAWAARCVWSTAPAPAADMLMSLFDVDPTAAGPEQEKVLQKVVNDCRR